MLADKMLGIEILQEILGKKWAMSLKLSSKPWAQAVSGRETCGSGPVFDAIGVPIFSAASLPLCVLSQDPDAWLTKLKTAERQLSWPYARGLSQDHEAIEGRRLEGGDKRLGQRLRGELGLTIPHFSQDAGAGVSPLGCLPKQNITDLFGTVTLFTIRQSAEYSKNADSARRVSPP